MTAKMTSYRRAFTLRAKFMKFIWLIYRHRSTTYFVLYVIGLILIFLTHSKLNLQSYDIKDILKTILDTEFIRSIPPIWGIFLFFVLPVIFPVIGKYLIQYFLVPYKTSKVLETLHDRCWEITGVGRQWISKAQDKILAEVDGFRTGIQVATKETAEICNALYDLTTSKKVAATCLQNIQELYNSSEKKTYMTTTMQKIGSLTNKLKFSRYYVAPELFDAIFNNNPSDPIKWFVEIHKNAQADLYYVNLETLKTLAVQNGISEEHLDILFFDGSVVFSLQTNSTDQRNQVIELQNGKNILFVMDENEKISGYQKLFNSLNPPSSTSINIIEKICSNGFNQHYGI